MTARRRAAPHALVAAALLALAACSRDARLDDRAREPAPPRPAATVLDAAAPPPTDADPLAACVAACVRSRQAEAIAIDVIERTCARTCALPPPAAFPP